MADPRFIEIVQVKTVKPLYDMEWECDSDGRPCGSSSEEEYLNEKSLEDEFLACVFLADCSMISNSMGDQKRDSSLKREATLAKGSAASKKRNSGGGYAFNNSSGNNDKGETSLPETQQAEDCNSDQDEIQEENKYIEEVDFEIVPPTWNSELTALGYAASKMECPNRAVQTILSCIKNMEAHELIHEKEALRKPGEFSAVSHMGCSEWIKVFPYLNKATSSDVGMIVNNIYESLPDKIYQWTMEEDKCKADYLKGVVALKAANDVKEENGMENTMQFEQENKEDDPFGDALLSEEDKEALKFKASVLGDDENEFQFTLNNSLLYPIIPERLVECQSVLYNQGIWRSKNFGALAPISKEVWIMLGDITPAQLAATKVSAEKMEKIVKKDRIKIMVDCRFFDKTCSREPYIYISQKSHMAYPTETRDEFYLKKLWRTMCPYLKCGCETPRGNRKASRAKEHGCRDNMTWLDHAVWYMFNNLDYLYPNMSCAIQMFSFRNMLKTTFKKGIMAYLSYLEIRSTLLDMTRFLVADPWADFMITKPRNKMNDICEKTIKHVSFIKTPKASHSNFSRSTRKTFASTGSSSQSKVTQPPRLTIAPGTSGIKACESATVECLGTPDLAGHSVTKAASNIDHKDATVAQSLKFNI